MPFTLLGLNRNEWKKDKLLKEERSISQIASEYGVHPNQLYKWKAQALENLAGLFEDERKGEKALKAEHDRQLKELYAEIGKLSTQLAWLTGKAKLCTKSGLEPPTQ